MKDLYGKTSVGRKLSGGGYGLLRDLRPVLSDFINLERALIKRPAVLPAALLSADCIGCFYSASVIPAVIISVLSVVLSCCLFFYGRQNRENRLQLPVICLITCPLLLYAGFFISSRLNADVNADAVSGELKCVVTEVSYDLSGNIDSAVRLEGGALAKVSFYCECGDVSPGDVLLLKGKLKEPRTAGNPGEFDYREYLRKQGIIYTFSCDKYTIAGKAGFPLNITGYLQEQFFGFRKRVFEAVTDTFDASYRALFAAVCLGDRSLISDGVSRDFEMSCCSHLLAVSGTHFSGFLLCVPKIIEMFKIKRRHALMIHALFCIIIGCLTGWSDSVTRAAVMSICMFAGREWLSAVSMAALVMMISDPFCALSSGFQMSFCAVIAIKVYSGNIFRFLVRIRLSENTAKLISLYIAAGAGLIPFWTDISMRPDPEHLVIQAAGTFLAGAACVFFVPCVILCLLLPFWSNIMSAPLYYCLKALSELVSAGSSLSEQSGMPVHFSRLLLVTLGFAVFLYMIPPCLMRRLLLKPAALFLAAVIGFEVFSFIDRSGCRVVFADVGQGDCCLIITPERTCLIDGGTYKEGSTTVSNLLDYYGISKADVCIMSHWDADHAGGIAALYDMGRTRDILTSYIPEADDRDKDVREFYKSLGEDSSFCSMDPSQLSLVLAGDRITLSDSVYLDVLYPPESNGGGNESSLVLMLHIDGETSILFTGDIGSQTESLLIEEQVLPDCDILKVAHHGSKYSSSAEFIEACSPEAAVISVGAGNLYGHPAPATLERLESYGCDIFRTDLDGAVVLEY